MPKTLIWSFVIGVLSWLAGYYLQKYDTGQEQIVEAPRWFEILCGTPRHDGRLTVQGMTFQIFGYLIIMGGVLCAIAVPDPYVRGMILGGWFVVLLFFGAIWVRGIAPRIF